MVRGGLRERLVLVMALLMVMILLLDSYMGDVRVGEDNSVLNRGIRVVKEWRERGYSEASSSEKRSMEDEGEIRIDSDYMTANELVTAGNLDDMVEDESIDMNKYIEETETKLTGSHAARTVKPSDHPGWSYSRGNTGSYTEALQRIRKPDFILPQDVVTPARDNLEKFIDIGLIMMNLKKSKKLNNKFAWKVRRTLSSMMTHSSGTPLHFVIVTDVKSLNAVGVFFSDFISKKLTESIIIPRSWRWRRNRNPPHIKFSFVDIRKIKDINPEFIESMMNCSMAKYDQEIDKYSSDLFYISPLYHRAFTNLEKIIFMDSTDLEFFEDVSQLEAEFGQMEETELMSVGLDLSPHYRKFLEEKYVVIHPESKLGLPGKTQGFNTGVVLFRLDRMRDSEIYNEYLEAGRVAQLRDRYMYDFALGDQDWLTNLGFSHPELFHLLPCQFNKQTSIQYLAPPWEDTFDQYHYCCTKAEVKIMHRNGCGPTPENCGNTVSPNSTYWEGRPSHIYYLHMDVEVLWDFMSDTHRYTFHLFKPKDSRK